MCPSNRVKSSRQQASLYGELSVTTLDLVLAHSSSHDQRSEVVVRPRVPKVVQRLTRAPHLEDVDAMLVERVCGDDEILAPCGFPCEPHRHFRAIQKALPLPMLHFDLACNDYGHVIGEDIGITSRVLLQANQSEASTP